MAKTKPKFNIDISKAITRLDIITQREISGDSVGFYKSAFKGQGLEFKEYRRYTTGEDASRIDWRASARFPRLLIKEYEEERNLKVFFLVDVSSSMVFGSINKLKNEYAAELVLSLSHSMLEAGDAVGFALFQEEVTEKSVPTSGKPQYYQFIRALVNPEFYGGGYDFCAALDFVNNYIDENTLLIIVSDFLGLRGKWEEKLRLVSHRYESIAMMIRDPRDSRLPSGIGQVVIEDPQTGEQALIEPGKIDKLYHRVATSQVNKIKKIFMKNNCDFLEFDTDKSYVNKLVNFFRMRALKIS